MTFKDLTAPIRNALKEDVKALDHTIGLLKSENIPELNNKGETLQEAYQQLNRMRNLIDVIDEIEIV